MKPRVLFDQLLDEGDLDHLKSCLFHSIGKISIGTSIIVSFGDFFKRL